MSMRDMYPDDLPASDLPEVVHRLKEVMDGLDEANDDWTRQEIYDRIGMSTDVISDVIVDLDAIERVMKAVVDA